MIDNRDSRGRPLVQPPEPPPLIEQIRKLLRAQREQAARDAPPSNVCAMAPSTYRKLCHELSRDYYQSEARHVTTLLGMRVFGKARSLAPGTIVCYHDPRINVHGTGVELKS